MGTCCDALIISKIRDVFYLKTESSFLLPKTSSILHILALCACKFDTHCLRIWSFHICFVKIRGCYFSVTRGRRFCAFAFLKLLFVVAFCELVRDVETIHDINANSIRKLILQYE